MKRNGHLGLSVLLLASLVGGCSSAGGEAGVREVGAALCSTVTVTSDHPSDTAVVGQTVVWTASPTCDGTAQYQFWFHNPSTGVWSITQPWSASNTFSWDTTGLPAGQWDMQVWARDAPTGNWFQAYTGNSFVLTATAQCSSETSTATPNPVVVNSSVTFANSAGGCVAPEFLVYHQAPGGSYQVDSGYSAANSTYVWNTTGALPGTHWFQIRARAQGSKAAFEAANTFSVTVLAATPCTGVMMSIAPAGQAAVGSSVIVSATATGCGAPTYEYWYQSPGGSWQILQSYTASSSVVWNTALATAGQYNLQVWARASGSSQPNETYVGGVYTLTPSTQTTAVSIGGGYGHNCVLLASGKVGCWGYDNEGELGNGTTSNGQTTPVDVTGLTSGLSLAEGYSHNCAVLLGGSIKCWGLNSNGQLGNSTYTDSTTPVTTTGITSAIAVGAGTAHTCAALSDGSARCWGFNTQGQLGDGTKTGTNAPVSVVGIATATQVSAGYYHSCGLLRDGTVRCWGLNSVGQLGDGTTTSSVSPVTVSGLSNVVSIATSSNLNCALKSDGTVWCWGTNGSAPGVGNTTPQSTPVQVSGVSTAKSLAVGSYHSCAGLQDGTAVCWGYNLYGQLGNATNTDSASPVVVSGLTTVASIGTARATSCAVLTDNTYRCWGYGSLGSLGNGGVTSSNVPVVVTAVP